MTRQQYQEILDFKEKRISMWEQYGCILSKEGNICEFMYPEVRV